jgi:hypothetical protein
MCAVLTPDQLNSEATFDIRDRADDPDIEFIFVLTREHNLSAAGSWAHGNRAITEADNCVISAFQNWTDSVQCEMITGEQLGIVETSRQSCWNLDDRAMLQTMIPPVKQNINDENSHQSATNRNPVRLQNYRSITNDQSFTMEKSHARHKMRSPNGRMHQTKEESDMHKGECRIADTLQSLIVLIDGVVMLELIEVYSRHTI